MKQCGQNGEEKGVKTASKTRTKTEFKKGSKMRPRECFEKRLLKVCVLYSDEFR